MNRQVCSSFNILLVGKIFQDVKSNGFCEEPYVGTQHCSKTAQVPNSGFPFTEGLQSLYLFKCEVSMTVMRGQILVQEVVRFNTSAQKG